MKIENTKPSVICSFLLGLSCVFSGCMYLHSVNDVSSASQASLFGYNKELTINTDPQGAFVVIKEDGTYKTLGQTPLKYSVDLINGSNSYFKVTVAHPGFHNQDVRIISGDANCYMINQNRRHLARYFFMDCLFLIPIPFNVLIGLPRHASIPDEAFTCDYLGAKIVYANEPIKLIPDNVALPVQEIASSQQIQAEREAEAARAAQQAAALAMVNAAVQGINAGVAASNGGTYVPPTPIIPTIPVVPAPTAASASNGGASAAPRRSKICPACFGSTKCRPCNGTGKNLTKKNAQGHIYDSAIRENCLPCNGTGKCLTCGGKGHL